jgi:hypothetical protein
VSAVFAEVDAIDRGAGNRTLEELLEEGPRRC